VKTTVARGDLDELGMADRILNALRGAQIETVEQLSKMTVLQLLGVKGCGKKCLNDVQRALAERGLAIINDMPERR
jgi:DNA-directed RNA polymerase subunit alpha